MALDWRRIAAWRTRRPVVLAIGVVVALAQLGQGRAASPPAPAEVVLTLAVVLAWWAHALRRHIAWTVLQAAAAIGLAWLGGGPAAIVGMVMALILLGRYPEPRAAALALVAALCYLAAGALRFAEPPLTIGFTALGLASAYGVSLSFRLLGEEHARTQAALEELRLARDRQLEAAKTEERARLAREIHDVLAHTLSALSVQLEGARLMLRRQPDDPRALEAVERSRRLAGEGLEEARRAIGALRGESLPGPDLLPELCAGFERDTGVSCRLEVEGVPVDLPPDARLALYRTAQEALTNVRKHVEATSVALRLRWDAEFAELTVEDRGTTRPAPPSPGHGLTGMRERAELLGGRLEAGPTAAGFLVRLRVPA